MIVSRPPPPTASSTQAGGAHRPADQGEGSGPSFAGLLASEQAPLAVASGELAFTSLGRDFRGSVSVGENAIRFDARPIVAPVHLPAGHELGAASAPSVQLAIAGTGIGEPGVQAEGALPDRGLVLSAGGIGGTRPGSSNVGAVGGVAERAGKTIGTSLVGAPTGLNRLPAATATIDGTRRTMPAARATAAAADTRPPASVTLSPEDVLVVVHGIALSSGERKALLHDVRELLVAYGLGDRAIRLRMDGGRNR